MKIRGPPSGEGAAVKAKYRLLESDGLPAVGDKIRSGEVYIHKFIPVNIKDNIGDPPKLPDTAYRERSEIYRGQHLMTSLPNACRGAWGA